LAQQTTLSALISSTRAFDLLGRPSFSLKGGILGVVLSLPSSICLSVRQRSCPPSLQSAAFHFLAPSQPRRDTSRTSALKHGIVDQVIGRNRSTTESADITKIANSTSFIFFGVSYFYWFL